MPISGPGLTPEELDELKAARLLALQHRADGQGWSTHDAMPFWDAWRSASPVLYNLFEDTLYCFPLGLVLDAQYEQVWLLSGATDEYPPFLCGVYDSVPDGSRPDVRLYDSGLSHYETDEGTYNLHKFEVEKFDGLDVFNAWFVIGFHNNDVASFPLYGFTTDITAQEQMLFGRPRSITFASSADWTAGAVPETLTGQAWAVESIALTPGIRFV